MDFVEFVWSFVICQWPDGNVRKGIKDGGSELKLATYTHKDIVVLVVMVR